MPQYLKRMCSLDSAIEKIHVLKGSKYAILQLLVEQSAAVLATEDIGLWMMDGASYTAVHVKGLFKDAKGPDNLQPGGFTTLQHPFNCPDGDKKMVLAAALPCEKTQLSWGRRVLASLTKHACLALEQRDLLEDSRKRAESLEVLNHVGRVFASTLNLEDLFSSIYHETSKIMRVDVFFVALYHQQQQTIEMAYMYEDGQRLPSFQYQVNHGPTSQVIKTREPLLFNVEDSLVPGAQRVGRPDKHTKSLMMVPVIFQDNVLGAISVQSYEVNKYDEDDLQLLSTIARQAAVAIENAKLYEKILEQATTDHMTGLMNRMAFYGALETALENARHRGESLSIVMVDSDSLKAINDRFGHSAGDDHIRNMVTIVTECVGPGDVVCRYGGDEFIVLLPGVDALGAMGVAEKILSRIRSTSCFIQGRPVSITASAGVAEYPTHGQCKTSLLNAADRAIYRAKGQGKNCVKMLDLCI